MDLKQFLKLEKKTLKQFSKENDLNYGTMKLYSSHHANMSPKMAKKIEQATTGKVTRLELLYPSDFEHRKVCKRKI